MMYGQAMSVPRSRQSREKVRERHTRVERKSERERGERESLSNYIKKDMQREKE